MKQALFALVIVLLNVSGRCQLLLNENFSDCSSGNLGVQNLWVSNGSGQDVQVNNSMALTYPNYSGGGNCIAVAALNGTDPHKTFTSAVSTAAASTFYLSFLVNVSNAAVASGAEYSIVLRNTNNIGYLSRFFLMKNGSSLEFGISKGASTAATVTAGNYQFNTTYVVVVRYDIVPGSSNDSMFLWINPLLMSEPSIANASLVLISGSDPSYGAAVDALMIHQRSSNSPVAFYDAFRVANGLTHAEAWKNLDAMGNSLPVNLWSFVALENKEGIRLQWKVSDESNFSKYEVERSYDALQFEKIGEVRATGSNSYLFDDMPQEKNIYYRLKMVDVDGAWKWSQVIHAVYNSKEIYNVYPNPVVSSAIIQTPKEFIGGIIQVTNEGGREVHRSKIISTTTKIDCSRLPRGIYYVFWWKGTATMWRMILKE